MQDAVISGRSYAKHISRGLLRDYSLIAAFSRKKADAEELVKGTDASAAASMDEVIAMKPDFIV